MDGAFVFGGVAPVVACSWLVAISRRSKTVLSGLLGTVGIALVAFAIGSAATGASRKAALAVTLIVLIIGSVVYGLGQAFERLLEQEPSDGNGDARPEH